jgi:hypothetical protein
MKRKAFFTFREIFLLAKNFLKIDQTLQFSRKYSWKFRNSYCDRENDYIFAKTAHFLNLSRIFAPVLSHIFAKIFSETNIYQKFGKTYICAENIAKMCSSGEKFWRKQIVATKYTKISCDLNFSQKRSLGVHMLLRFCLKKINVRKNQHL